MKNRTERYINRQNGHSFIKNVVKTKAFAIGALVTALLIVLGALYLWYSNNYGNSVRLTLTPEVRAEYEWQQAASTYGITGDYVISRTRQTLVNSDTGLIMSSLMIQGRLTSQTEERSEKYLLEDQANLLRIYVLDADKGRATSLKNSIVENFRTEEGLYRDCLGSDYCSVESNMSFLDALLYYYDAYGRNSDYELITELISKLFDDSGNIIEEPLTVINFHGASYIATDDDQEETEETASFVGIKLSSVRLRLINNLEQNGLVPAGTYERYLGIVLGGRVSVDLPVFAYAYTIENGNINYLYRYDSDTGVNSFECIKVMRNLSEVGALPTDSYAWLKSELYNNSCIYSSYGIIGGDGAGSESVESYYLILKIALYQNDIDLFSEAAASIATRVATKSTSPVLSMVFRQSDTRFTVYASDNLELYMALI